MRTKPKNAIDQIEKIKCRPKKTITVSSRVPQKRGGAVMIQSKKLKEKSTVKEKLISKKLERRDKVQDEISL